MAACCDNVEHTLGLIIPLLDEFLDLVKWAIRAATEEYHAYDAFAGAGFVTPQNVNQVIQLTAQGTR